jgi:hypothetical protein
MRLWRGARGLRSVVRQEGLWGNFRSPIPVVPPLICTSPQYYDSGMRGIGVGATLKRNPYYK